MLFFQGAVQHQRRRSRLILSIKPIPLSKYLREPSKQSLKLSLKIISSEFGVDPTGLVTGNSSTKTLQKLLYEGDEV